MADFTLEAGLQVAAGDINAAIKSVQDGFDKTKIRVTFDTTNVTSFIKQVQSTFDSNKIKLNLDTGDLKGGSVQSVVKTIDDLYGRINKLTTTMGGGNDFAGTIGVYQKRIEELGVSVGKAFGVGESALGAFSSALAETITGGKSLVTFGSYLNHISKASDELKASLMAALTVAHEKNVSTIVEEFERYKTAISNVSKELAVLSKVDIGSEKLGDSLKKLQDLYSILNGKGLGDEFKNAIESGNFQDLKYLLEQSNFTIEQQRELVDLATKAYRDYSTAIAAAGDAATKADNKTQLNDQKKLYDDIASTMRSISGLQLKLVKAEDANVISEINAQIDNLYQHLTAMGQQDIANALKTGDFTQFEAAVRASSLSLEQQDAIIKLYRDSLDKLTITQKEHIAQEQRESEEAQKHVQTMNNAISVVKRYITTFLGFASVAQVLRSVYNNVVDLDKAVVDLQIATGYSREVVSDMVSDYADLGQQLGVSTVDITKAADSWLRQGYESKEATTLITASTMLAKLGQIEVSAATDYLTSSMKGYGISVEEVIGIVDRLSAVDLVSATSAGDLAEAMQKTAVTANQVGIPMERLIGMLATISEVSQQSASTVGTAMKSMLARMVNIKAGFLADPETGDDLSNVEAALRGVGIALRDDNGDFRNLNDVLGEIAKKWKTLSGIDRNAVAVALGGTRQQENVRILMEYWDQVAKLTDVAANSTGTAQEKFEAYSGGIEAKINALKAAWQSLSNSILSSDFVKNAVSFLTKVVNLLDEIPTTLIVIAGILSKISIGAFKSGVFGALTSGSSYIGSLQAGLTSVTATLSKLLGVFGSIAPYVAVAAGIVTTVAGGIELVKTIAHNLDIDVMFEKASKSAEEYSQEIDENNQKAKDFDITLAENKKRLDELNSLKTNGQITLEQEKEISRIQIQNQELDDQIEKLKNRNDELARGLKIELGQKVGLYKDKSVDLYDYSSDYLTENVRKTLALFGGNINAFENNNRVINADNGMGFQFNASQFFEGLSYDNENIVGDLDSLIDTYKYYLNLSSSEIEKDYKEFGVDLDAATEYLKVRIFDAISFYESALVDAVNIGDKSLEQSIKGQLEILYNVVGYKKPTNSDTPDVTGDVSSFIWKKNMSGKIKADSDIKYEDAIAGVIKVFEAEARSDGLDDKIVSELNPNLAEHVAVIAKNDEALQRYIKDWQDGVITSEEFLEVLKNAQEYSLYGTGSTSWDRVIDELDSYQSKVDSVVESREKAAAIEQEINGIEDDIYSGRYELYGSPKEIYSLFDDELAGLASEYSHVAQEAQEHQKELELSKGTVKALTEKYPALTQDIIAYNNAVKAGSNAQAEYNKLISDMKILADQNVASEINSQLSSFIGINDQGSFAAWMLNMENTLATTGKWNTDDITAFMQVFKDMQGDLSRTSKQDALTKLKDLAKERPDWEPWIKFFDTLFEFEKNHTQYETAFKAIQDFFNSSTPGEKQNAIEQLNDELEQLGVSQNVRKDIYDLLNVATTPAQKKNALQSMLDTLIALGDVNLSSLIEQTKELMKELDPAATERSAARNAQSALSSFMGAKNVADLEDAAIQMRKALWDSGNFETTNQRDLFFNLIFGDLLNNRDFSPENLFNLSKEAFSKMVADKRFSDWEPVFQEMFYSFDAQGNKRTAASNIVGALESYLGIESPDQRDQIARQIKDDLRTAFGEEKATQMMEDIFSPLLNADTFNMSDNGGIITQVLSAMFGTEDFSAFEYLAKDLYKTIADPTVWQNYTSPLETFFGSEKDTEKAKAWGEFLDKLTESGDVDSKAIEAIKELPDKNLDQNSFIAMLISLLHDSVNPDVIRALQEMRLTAKETDSSRLGKIISTYGGNITNYADRPVLSSTQHQQAGWFGTPDGTKVTFDSQSYKASDYGLTDEGHEFWINVTPIYTDENGVVQEFTPAGLEQYVESVIKKAQELGVDPLESFGMLDEKGILIGVNKGLNGLGATDAENSALMVLVHALSEAIQQTSPVEGNPFSNSAYANMQGPGMMNYGQNTTGAMWDVWNMTQEYGYSMDHPTLNPEQIDALLEKFPKLSDEIKKFNQGEMDSVELWNELMEAMSADRFSDAADDMESLLKTLKKSKKGTWEYEEAVEGLSDMFYGMIDGIEDYSETLKDMLKGDTDAFEKMQSVYAEGLATKWDLDADGLLSGLYSVQQIAAQTGQSAEEVAAILSALGLFKIEQKPVTEDVTFKYLDKLTGEAKELSVKAGGTLDMVSAADVPPKYGGHKGGGGGKKGGGGKTSILSEQYTNDKGLYDTMIDNLKELRNLYEEGSEEWLRNQQRIIETYQAYAKTVQDEYDRLVKAGVSMTDKEMQTLAKDLIKVNNEIYDAAKEYWEAVRDNMKESMEHIVDQMDAVLDLRKAHKDLLTELRQENRELEKQYKIAQDEAAHPGLTEAEHELLFSSEDYKRLTGMLQDISKQADALYEEYKNKIASVTEDETYAISYITDEYERQLGLLESQYEIAKQQLAVEKARQELQNTLRERNTAVLINGAWTWMADPDAVQAAMEKVADAEVELEDAITDSEFNKETAEIETARDAIKSSIDAMEALEFAIEDLAEGIVDLADSINENIFNAIGTTSRNYLKQTKGHGLELFMDELTELQETSGLVFSNTDVEKLYSLLSSGNTINSSNIFDDSIVHDSAAIASILSNTSNVTGGNSQTVIINGITLSDSDSEMLLNALERVSYTWQA